MSPQSLFKQAGSPKTHVFFHNNSPEGEGKFKHTQKNGGQRKVLNDFQTKGFYWVRKTLNMEDTDGKELYHMKQPAPENV